MEEGGEPAEGTGPLGSQDELENAPNQLQSTELRSGSPMDLSQGRHEEGIPPEEASDFDENEDLSQASTDGEDEDGDEQELEEFEPDEAQAMLEQLRAVWNRLRSPSDVESEDEDDDSSQGGEEGGESDKPSPEINYNRTLPATHAYLGADLDTVAGRTFLSSEQRIVLPIFPLNGIVLLPGETLPLRLFSDAYVGLVQRLLNRGSGEGEVQGTLGVVNIPKRERQPSFPASASEDDVTHRLACVGTTAEIRSLAKQPSGDGAINAVTVGRQRFRILRAWMDNGQHMLYAEVVIIPDDEPTTFPRGAFVSMGGRYSSAPFSPPTKNESESESEMKSEQKSESEGGRLRGKVMGASASLPFGRRVFSVGWHPLWVYALYDTPALALRAKRMFEDLILNEGGQKRPSSSSSSSAAAASSSSSSSSSSSPADPVSYSFWLAANLPLDDKVRQELLEINCAADRLRREMEIMKTYDTICCRRCGRQFGGRKDVFSMSLEGPVSAYVNPSGFVHQTITLRKARGLALEGSPSTENSWFPGYAWTIAYCARCFNHMGWRFTAVSADTSPATFYGLSRASITHVPANPPPDHHS